MTAPASTVEELTAQRDRARQDHADLVARGLRLDLTRGKPSPRQLDLAEDLLDAQAPAVSADGTDLRNYGGLQGLPELRAIFGDSLQVPVEQLLAAGNSSLELMHDALVFAQLGVVPGGERRWVDEPEIAFLCPVPGYDRHFALCERFGIRMIPVPMTAGGPDMDVVERLVAEDPRVKGIWCVPKCSNPDGTVYSDETVRRLAAMPTAARDFRIFWDNAYAVHHLGDEPAEIADLLGLCAEHGNPDRAFVFGSTSKITFAGGGVAFFGASPANVEWWLSCTAKRSIGPDKINQLRHVRFLRDAEGLREHMRRHAALLRPKFDAVDKILTSELGGTGLASWTSPAGGYFISLQVPEGCARAVVAKAKEAGINLTPAGATHPYGDDPADRVIRIAPTYPELPEVEQAIAALATCVRLVGTEKILADLNS
ncbi:aminotransferase class I/II-fold pyridoxal phosphate-dependent enzyme [Saccharopolyspora erythraea]|uniref:aminotransferase class I/II-fold pyridoxal phosphate-dependent enzyme n=1 Tax=Saccharopolyspora erythraea TaxID=1836 RepID=UPI00038CB195|nr:aminotransferase class I/II-fold pyridoxal phosphate-dependent enzyme [Saccharopolyspora erythraea]EQD83105.1 aminotransferase [Saccharopolyspora erythraea D]QRK87470.1 aminotransferase class I/II-fold pyridoxal phosphate-dependent enzyme [Saccharopolyspora erythraea]